MNHDNIHSLRTSVQPLLSFAEEVIPGCQLAIDLATSDGGAIRLCEPTSSLPAPPNTTTSPILHGDETIGWLIGTAPAILQNHLPALAGLAAQALTSDLNTRNSLARRSLSRILATTSLPEIPTDFAVREGPPRLVPHHPSSNDRFKNGLLGGTTRLPAQTR